jgi:hypothetical protein
MVLRSARTRLLCAAVSLEVLIQEGRIERARSLALERPWLGPFESVSEELNVPPELLPRVHLELDRLVGALEATPPQVEGARRHLGELLTLIQVLP